MRWLIGMFLITCTSLAAAQTAAVPKLDPEFLKARQARIDALSNGDAETFARYTSEKFIVIDGNPDEVQNKAQRIARHRAVGTQPPREDERIIPYNNDTVVLSWRQTGPNGAANRILEVWVKEDGMWRCGVVQMRDVTKH
jgi:hypothetical protein